MKIVTKSIRWSKKLLKWTGITMATFLLLILLAGLCYRLVMPTPQEPLGELIAMEGYQLHIVQEGEKSNKPTLVIEAGAGLSTEFYHWLSEDLKTHMRVIRYDRIGIGKSDALDAPRDPESVARRLHTLLENAGEAPPYIMMGHSLGGPQIRVFTELYPEEVQGMFFLDATHPDHVERYNAPEESSFKFKAILAATEFQAILCDVGVFPLFDELFGTPYSGPGLPDVMNERFKECLQNGKAFRAYKEETKYYHETLERSGKVEDFGNIAIRAFHAVSEDSVQRVKNKEKLHEKIKFGKHKAYADLSTNGKSIEIPGNHVSIFTEKENAKIICDEVKQLLVELGYKY